MKTLRRFVDRLLLPLLERRIAALKLDVAYRQDHHLPRKEQIRQLRKLVARHGSAAALWDREATA